MQRSRIVRSAVTLTALTLVAGAAPGRSTRRPRHARPGRSPRGRPGRLPLLQRLRRPARLPARAGPAARRALRARGRSVPAAPASRRSPRARPPRGGGRRGGTAGARARRRAEPPGATSATGTNIQVAGVDEADVTKTSGRPGPHRRGRRAHRADRAARADRQVRASSAAWPTDWQPEQLLVQGTTVLLLGTRARTVAPRPASRRRRAPGGSTRRVRRVRPNRPRPEGRPAPVAEVDVADAGARPALVRDPRRWTAGSAGGALWRRRRQLACRTPLVTAAAGAARARAGRTRGARPLTGAGPADRIAASYGSPVDQWLPAVDADPGDREADARAASSTARPGRRAHGVLRARHARDAHVRPALRRRRPWDGAGVVADGTTLYSTGDHTYVAHERPAAADPTRPVGAGRAVRIAAIATPSGDRLEIARVRELGRRRPLPGSGSVDGTLLEPVRARRVPGQAARRRRPEAPDRRLRRWARPRPAAGARRGLRRGPTAVPPPPPAAAVVRPSRRRYVGRRHRARAARRAPGAGRPGRRARHGARRSTPSGSPARWPTSSRSGRPTRCSSSTSPTRRTRGSPVESDLPGYSAYLHPLGDGPAARRGPGRQRRRAHRAAMSLFDVSDPAAPAAARPGLAAGRLGPVSRPTRTPSPTPAGSPSCRCSTTSLAGPAGTPAGTGGRGGRRPGRRPAAGDGRRSCTCAPAGRPGSTRRPADLRRRRQAVERRAGARQGSRPVHDAATAAVAVGLTV